jgi:hypothetical protein
MDFNLTGRRIGPYQLHRLIGRGGMAWVYRATHTVMDWDVALKILDPSLTGDADFVERFRREAKLLDQMQHPNIVRVRDAAWQERFFYIAMEYLDGEALDTTLARVKRLSPPQAISLGLQVADALSYGHTRFRLIHRDIKPGNIFVLRDGSFKVLDFGVAVLLGGRPSARTRIGTPDYMAYEQCQGNADERSDIYSLGATLYEALTGRVPPPFGVEPPIPPRQLNPQVSPALEQVIVCALQRDPARRFQSVAAMGSALHAAWTSPGIVSPVKPAAPGNVVRNRQPPSRTLILGGGIIIAVLAFIFLLASLSSGGSMSLVLTRTPALPVTATIPALLPAATIAPPAVAPAAERLLTVVEPSAGETLVPDSPAPVFRWEMPPLEAGQRYVVVLDDQRSAPIDFVRPVDDAYQYDGSQQWPEPLAPGPHTWGVVIVARSDQGGDDVWHGPEWTFTASAPADTSTPEPTSMPTSTRRPSTATRRPPTAIPTTASTPRPAATIPTSTPVPQIPVDPLHFSFSANASCAGSGEQNVSVSLTGYGGQPPYTYYNDMTLLAQSVSGSVTFSFVTPAGNPVPLKLIVIDSTGQRVMENQFYKSGLHYCP